MVAAARMMCNLVAAAATRDSWLQLRPDWSRRWGHEDKFMHTPYGKVFWKIINLSFSSFRFSGN
jgi:hypothetical protein